MPAIGHRINPYEYCCKHYRHTNSITDYKKFPGRSHYTVGQDGWEEVADYALEWAVEHAKRPAA